MCSNPDSPYVVGLSKTEHRALVFQADCDKWECVECQKKKKSKWVARAIIGSKTISSYGIALQFITITMHPSLKNFAATSAVFPRAFPQLYARMKRKMPSLHYLMVMEQHKNGRLHAHMLTDYCPTLRSWKIDLTKCGFGYQTDIKKVENEGVAAAYVSKYIGKSLGGMCLPQHFRRVRVTANWATLPELHESPGQYDWLVCRTKESLFRAVETCQQTKTTMIELRTGIYFDYGEAVDHWYS